MLHRWINCLVKSEVRKRKILSKPRIEWPTVLQTGNQGTLKTICKNHNLFPERVHLNVELHPYMVRDKTVTARISLDSHHCVATPIYQQLNGDRQRIFGRCSRIDILLKDWYASTGNVDGLILSVKPNTTVYSKEFYTCTYPIYEAQTVVSHQVVSMDKKRIHIYPYGGYLALDGPLGDALYMLLSSDVNDTKINVHSYSALQAEGVNLFDENSKYVLQGMDSSARHKILPLQKLVEYGEVKCEITTVVGEDTWVQSYQSDILNRKDGTYEALLTMRRVGKASIRRMS